MRWSKSWSNKWYQSHNHRFQSQESHVKGRILEGLRFYDAIMLTWTVGSWSQLLKRSCDHRRLRFGKLKVKILIKRLKANQAKRLEIERGQIGSVGWPTRGLQSSPPPPTRSYDHPKKKEHLFRYCNFSLFQSLSSVLLLELMGENLVALLSIPMEFVGSIDRPMKWFLLGFLFLLLFSIFVVAFGAFAGFVYGFLSIFLFFFCNIFENCIRIRGLKPTQVKKVEKVMSLVSHFA